MAGKIAGGFIRLTNFVIRILQLCASVIVLGIMSYFLAVLADHDMEIGKWLQAVEGIAGAATLYTLVGSIFTLCIGGIAFFAAIAMMFDVLFAAAFVAVAVLTRDGTGSCEGRVTTPLGSGDVNDNAPGYGKGGFGTGDGQNLTFMPSLRSACTLQKGIFAISIIAIFLFLLSLYPQIAYVRHRRDVKRFGHSSTSGRRSFWRFGRGRPDSTTDYAGTGTPVGTIPLTETNPSPDLPAEKPPRYSRFFTRGKKVDPVKFEDPELAARPDGNGYGYGNSAYVYGNGKTAEPYYGVDNTATATPAPPPQPAYGYGPSATANYGYSHGY